MQASAIERARVIGDVFEAIGDAVALVGSDWRPIWHTGSLARLIGHTEAEIQARDPRSFISPSSLGVVQASHAAHEEGRPVEKTLRVRLLHAEGREIPVEVLTWKEPTIPGGRLVIIRDVSDLDERERRLSATSDELNTILANVPLSIVTMEANGTILRVNPATERMFGWSPHELQGRSVAMLAAKVNPEEHERFLEGYFRTRTLPPGPGRVVNRTRRVEARRRDGTTFPVDLRVAELPQPGGMPHFVGVLEDLTERDAAEARLLRSQRAEALVGIAAGVAHECNNLLMVVGGNAELLRMQNDRVESLDAIDVAVKRAGRIVRSLLHYAGRGIEQRAPVELNETLSDFLGMVRSAIDGDVPVELHGSGDALWVDANLGQLEQVVLSLVLNARDAIREVVGRGVERSPVIEVRLIDETPHRVGFEVVDNGCGMSREVLTRAIDPFFTTKPPDQGPGLGLSAASGIVEAHGGALEIESEQGRGTRVRVTFPRSSSIPTGDTAVSRSPVDRLEPDPGALVLVVDDEEFIRTLLEGALEMQGYRVATAADGVEALQRLDGLGPDLVLLDLNMPRMAGEEVLERLKEDDAHPPVIVMSGHVQRPIDGVAAFIEKPFALPELFRLVAEHVQRSSNAGRCED